MQRRGVRARRIVFDWGVRGALMAAAAIVGYVSVTQSLAVALKNDPERAHILAPHDGQITASLAQGLLTPKATSADLVKADRLARLALRQDPTAVKAASTLGLAIQMRGDTAGARRLFAYAEALSRRELSTQLWGIEDAVSRNDIGGALREYDIALRTSRIAPDLLFPVLGSAIEDPAIRTALTRTLSANPAWGPSFTLHAAANSSPRAAVELFRDLYRAKLGVTEEPNARLIDRLIASGLFEDAWSYYSTIRPGADRRMSRDSRFVADLAMPTPFDWRLVDSAGVSALITPGKRGGILDFSAPSSVGGPMVQQMQMLPPGLYRIEGHSMGIEQPESSRPYWTLSCRDGRELGRVALPNSAQAGGMFGGQFNVPAGCSVQTLALVARPSDAMSGVAGQVDYVRLSPSR